MRVTAYLVDGTDPVRHLAIESLLVDGDAGPLLLFYVNGPSVIIGRNQNPWRETSPESDVPWYRRTSGGGAVYHDGGNLNWAFIVPRNVHSQEAELESIARGISACGVPVSPGERGGIFCDPASGHGGRKVSGTARRIGRSSVLHHGTVLVSTDLSRMRACLKGLPTVDDHAIASVPASPVNLAELRPGLRLGDCIESISRAVAGTEPLPLPAGMLAPGRLEAEESRLRSDGWACGTTPPFGVATGSGDSAATVVVVAGFVSGISGSPASAAILADLVGRPFSFALAAKITAMAGGAATPVTRQF